VIFKVIRKLKAKGLTVNIALLCTELEKRNLLEKVGDYGTFAALTDDACPANTQFYEQELLAAHRRHQALKAIATAKEALEGNGDMDAALEALQTALDKSPGSAKSGKVITFPDLQKQQFPDEQFFVPGLLSSGLTILSGASKTGKSWLALEIVTALDAGGAVLGLLRAEKCQCLYLALEDTPRRIQRRLLKQGAPTFQGSGLVTSRMGIGELRALLKQNPQYRYCIIDTLGKFLSVEDMNDYAQTTHGLSALKAVADDLNVGILCVHHTRKNGDEDGDHMASSFSLFIFKAKPLTRK